MYQEDTPATKDEEPGPQPIHFGHGCTIAAHRYEVIELAKWVLKLCPRGDLENVVSDEVYDAANQVILAALTGKTYAETTAP